MTACMYPIEHISITQTHFQRSRLRIRKQVNKERRKGPRNKRSATGQGVIELGQATDIMKKVKARLPRFRGKKSKNLPLSEDPSPLAGTEDLGADSMAINPAEELPQPPPKVKTMNMVSPEESVDENMVSPPESVRRSPEPDELNNTLKPPKRKLFGFLRKFKKGKSKPLSEAPVEDVKKVNVDSIKIADIGSPESKDGAEIMGINSNMREQVIQKDETVASSQVSRFLPMENTIEEPMETPKEASKVDNFVEEASSEPQTAKAPTEKPKKKTKRKNKKKAAARAHQEEKDHMKYNKVEYSNDDELSPLKGDASPNKPDEDAKLSSVNQSVGRSSGEENEMGLQQNQVEDSRDAQNYNAEQRRDPISSTDLLLQPSPLATQRGGKEVGFSILAPVNNTEQTKHHQKVRRRVRKKKKKKKDSIVSELKNEPNENFPSPGEMQVPL